MAVMDEFREERAALKNAGFKKKWQYFWDYYKWHVIGISVILATIISLIYSNLTAVECVFNGYFLNTYVEDVKQQEFIQTFAEVAGIDLNEYDILIDSTLQYNTEGIDDLTIATQQKIMVSLAAAEIDFIVANEDAFLHYATPDTFCDLRNLYTENELAAFSKYIYYVDGAVIRAKEAAYDQGLIDSYSEPVYDHFAPEKMADPIPIALCIQDCPIFDTTFYFYSGNVLFGFVMNSQHFDTTKIFVDHIFEGLIE